MSATKALRWTRPLIEAVIEELYVDDHFEELLGRAPSPGLSTLSPVTFHSPGNGPRAAADVHRMRFVACLRDRCSVRRHLGWLGAP